MNKGLKYNKEVRGTGDDWLFERCRTYLLSNDPNIGSSTKFYTCIDL